MVFQSSMDALNPVVTIGEQIIDTIAAHGAAPPGGTRARAGELLAMVGLQPGCIDSYAHQLSGGMRQRVGIALALALEPGLVILDEPTTALDVIVEKEILEQIKDLQQRLGFSVLFITHDLARMLQFSDRVAVFYAARLAERTVVVSPCTSTQSGCSSLITRSTPSSALAVTPDSACRSCMMFRS